MSFSSYLTFVAYDFKKNPIELKLRQLEKWVHLDFLTVPQDIRACSKSAFYGKSGIGDTLNHLKTKTKKNFQ